MAATPTSAEIKAEIISDLDSYFKNPTNITTQLDAYIEAITDGIASAWSTWQSNVGYSGDSVSGAGLGIWTGTGGGGSFDTTISITITDPYLTTWSTAAIDAIQNGWESKFNTWVGGYSFAGSVTWTGTSTATESKVGTFDADAVELLSTYGTAPTGVATDIKGRMVGFDFPNAKSGLFIDAIGSALETKFNSWAGATSVDVNVTGVAAAGTGNGTGTSQNGVVS